MIDLTIPEKLRNAVRHELTCGESIEWIGRPRPVFFTRDSSPEFSAGLTCTVFMGFWLTALIEKVKAGEVFYAFIGFLSCLLLKSILGGIFSPLRAFRSCLKTVYAITDRRVIVISGEDESVQACPVRRISGCEHRLRDDGTGDLLINCGTRSGPDGYFEFETIEFLRLEDMHEARRKLRRLTRRSEDVESLRQEDMQERSRKLCRITQEAEETAPLRLEDMHEARRKLHRYIGEKV